MAELELDLSVDARKAVSGIDDFADALEDVVREFDDISDAGDDTQRDLERNFRAIARDAKKAGDDAGDDMRKGLKDGTDGFKDEAGQSGREAAASFSGGFDDVGDFLQETAANAFTGFGPAGAAAGTAAAVGIGLVTAAIQAVNEENEKSQERVAEWADAYIEAGGKILDAGVLVARFQEIITDPEKFKTAEENARNWGVSVQTAVAAMSGNEGAIHDVEVALRDQGEAARESALEAQELAEANGSALLALTPLEQAYRDGKDALGKLTGEMDRGRQRAGLLTGYYLDLINTTSDVTKEVDELGNELYTLPDETQIMIDAETGQATQNVSNFKGDVDGIPETVTTTVKVLVDDWNWRNWKPNPKSGMVYGVAAGMTRNQAV